MAFEKKSLISSRTVTQKAIAASNATPLSSKVTTEPKVASVRIAKVGVGLSKQGVGLSKRMSKQVNLAKRVVASRAFSKSLNLSKTVNISKSVTKRISKAV